MTEASESTFKTIIANPTLSQRVKVGGVGLMFLAFAVAFTYDGFIRYPRQNRESYIEQVVERLTDSEIAAEKDAVVAAASSEARTMLQAADPRKDPILMEAIYERVMRLRPMYDLVAKHNDRGLGLQKLFAVVCGIGGIGLVFRVATHSRGQYRLEGDTLHIPGHPPVPLQAITRIDKRRWDKKGIAEIEYQIEGQEAATFVLDDYYFERKPTDEIFERIEEYARSMAAPEESPQ